MAFFVVSGFMIAVSVRRHRHGDAGFDRRESSGHAC
jgi:hypothetical protein